MKDEKTYIALTHALIRTILMECSVEEAYEKIFKYLFPCSILAKFEGHSDFKNPSTLQEVCDFIYRLDEDEVGRASCFSASIVVQALAFLNRMPTDMVIGLRLVDRKMVGHAWVEVSHDSRAVQVVSPGRVAVRDYRVIKRLSPEAVVDKIIFPI